MRRNQTPNTIAEATRDTSATMTDCLPSPAGNETTGEGVGVGLGGPCVTVAVDVGDAVAVGSGDGVAVGVGVDVGVAVGVAVGVSVGRAVAVGI
jgi:hypothetical protein